eukprot:CAMPEP_0194578946 /NCGR_PEP_ID=MMETSP0292-20121207/13185_1 /TAXON_ID=39354 /ORGANISM="Heterosigma akashiwo, Strain CCMP2393" /LENGTH=32 /DNA_ID= /DNA_START= /DNA_END= /DNA_ORIENTATION=
MTLGWRRGRSSGCGGNQQQQHQDRKEQHGLQC